MLGDAPPRRVGGRVQDVPAIATAADAPVAGGNVVFPGTRTFKIAENESPRPQDRVYFSFNYFDDLNGVLNRRLTSDLRHVNTFTETFGVEKTFLDGNASLGLRLPLNTFQGESLLPEFGRTSTAVGDLSILLKYAMYADPEQDNWLVVGLAVTAPTGPDAFAGLGPASLPHSARLQPFVGWLWNGGNWYVQGFSAIDIPTTSPDVTLDYNDVGLGCFLFRSPDPTRFITAIAPTVEVHVNTPLNHRGAFNLDDPLGTADVVDLTGGVNVDLFDRARLAVGVVAPVTGPRPFNVEVLAQLRLRY